ncbi:MAG: M20/M25/M40 family metallo-hydrolase [Clostridiales bacterium]|nr:MAG: M20/M25/M40 family metallo-hydrolase [Clostridiales bacterium]
MLQCPTVTGCDQKHFDDLHAVMWEIAPEFSKLPRYNVRNNAMIIKWEGKKHDRPLVLMAHQDVVPEEDPKGWKYPPYSGAIEEGKIWGRGAVDCKCMVFGSMVAANELINEGFVPEQDIYFCYGDDEENSGGSAIAEAKYLSETLGVKTRACHRRGRRYGFKRTVQKIPCQKRGRYRSSGKRLCRLQIHRQKQRRTQQCTAQKHAVRAPCKIYSLQ